MTKLKAFIWLAIIGILVFLSVKLVPHYVENYQFQDELNNLARVVTYAQAKTDDDVRADVLHLARQHALPVKSEQIKVSKTQTGVTIEVNYIVVVPVPGYTFNLKFNPAAGNRMITSE
jgi:cell division protein FtsL